ncbi:BMP family ABC transporter substrate-binding protein [Pontibacillus litoralis]|uniref:Transcriptional regulator n=1 Tax=Pontibacillus litoralis JSM 072002 TaxID=1385512 RepID=A0A0A5G6R2_9BACI|nr:BMP family ABC transporter substrate-binding protein [Pontibacillus litoralis]KGX87734.1 transcriptional regulator [Pontibacillus litoralis JSM 072002]
MKWKKVLPTAIILFLLFGLIGCTTAMGQGNLQKVGMLVDHSVHDQAWGKKGYEGLLDIKEEMNVDVYFKQHIQSKQAARIALKEFSDEGINLVFGHGKKFGDYFNELHQEFPDMHFVYFNGNIQGDNMTSLNFDGYSMGFFGGMVASGMTDIEHVGVIAAFEWQPEVEGFYEGAKFQNPNTEVTIEYVNSWEDKDKAIQLYDELKEEGVDVFYPAGDGFNVPIMEAVKDDHLHSIGYVSDQSHIGESTVLTSTIQHVDQLYVIAAKLFDEGDLPDGFLTFGFQDGAISLGEFSSSVPAELQHDLDTALEKYKETGVLPNEQSK